MERLPSCVRQFSLMMRAGAVGFAVVADIGGVRCGQTEKGVGGWTLSSTRKTHLDPRGAPCQAFHPKPSVTRRDEESSFLSKHTLTSNPSPINDVLTYMACRLPRDVVTEVLAGPLFFLSFPCIFPPPLFLCYASLLSPSDIQFFSASEHSSQESPHPCGLIRRNEGFRCASKAPVCTFLEGGREDFLL